MFRYENMATTTISVNLKNGFTIVAMANWNNTEKRYYVTLYIKRTDVNMLDMIEDAENLLFEADSKEIKSEITSKITELFRAGCFDYYIDRYEYQMLCFDKGNELFENERINE